MSGTQDTTTETDAQPARNDDGTFAAETGVGGDTAADADGHVRDERGDAQQRHDEEQREDHLLTVTFQLDTEGEANHGFLRDREVPVEAVVQNELGRPLEEVLHDAKQQVKYDQQGQQRQQPGGQR